MLTPAEYLKTGIPESREIWLNGLEIVEHCLKADFRQTFFKDEYPAFEEFDSWSEGMQARTKWDGKFEDIFENAYKPKKKWTRYNDDSGDLMVDSYISNEELPFEAWEKRKHQERALSIVLQGCVPWRDREKTYMVERHREVYKIVAQCEAENRPCRVVVAKPTKYLDLGTENNILKIFFLVKDYNEPIFPSLWGTFSNNLYTNNFGNVFADFFIGTHMQSNGHPQKALYGLRQYFPDDEELILFGNLYE